MERATIAIIASHEFRTNLRSRWTAIFGMVFAALALAISYFGLITQDIAGFQGFTRTVASLLNLVLYIFPLVGLVTGSFSLTGEKGANELLFAQPASRTDILLGKALGASASVSVATALGFGVAGTIVAGQAGYEGVMSFLALASLAIALSFVFIGLGLLLGAISGNRAKVLGAALALWFFFVLFYDLLVLGISMLLNQRTANAFLVAAMFANPIDVVRLSTLFSISGETVLGAGGAALIKLLGTRAMVYGALITALSLWAALPVWIAGRALERRDI